MTWSAETIAINKYLRLEHTHWGTTGVAASIHRTHSRQHVSRRSGLLAALECTHLPRRQSRPDIEQCAGGSAPTCALGIPAQRREMLGFGDQDVARGVGRRGREERGAAGDEVLGGLVLQVYMFLVASCLPKWTGLGTNVRHIILTTDADITASDPRP